MKTRKERIYLAGFTLLAIILGSLLLAIAQAHFEKRRAERFLVLLQDIQVGSTSRAAVQKMTAPFHDSIAEDIDGRGTPELSFVFDNIWLARLKLAPYADFRGWITFRDDVVVSKSARVLSTSGAVAHVTEEKRGQGYESGTAPEDAPNHVVRGLDMNFPNRPTPRISVEDDDTFPETMRRKDWMFKFDCLTRLSGCTDARLMLPIAVPTPLPEHRQ